MVDNGDKVEEFECEAPEGCGFVSCGICDGDLMVPYGRIIVMPQRPPTITLIGLKCADCGSIAEFIMPTFLKVQTPGPAATPEQKEKMN